MHFDFVKETFESLHLRIVYKYAHESEVVSIKTKDNTHVMILFLNEL